MKRFVPLFTIAMLAAAPLSAAAEVTSENIAKGKGILTCSGGGGAKPLFSSECRQVSINRVTASGGSIKYEVTCTDSSNVSFQMACDAFAFEQKQVVF